MLKLSALAGLNETAVRDILNGKMKNPTYKTLYHLAKVLKCSVDELVLETGEVIAGEEILLFNNPKINEKIFAKVIDDAEKLILKKKLKINNLQRTMIYFSWYDLLVMNQHEAVSKTQLEKLMSEFK
jgi:transcriptional regulator with XRE-family HTH domain